MHVRCGNHLRCNWCVACLPASERDGDVYVAVLEETRKALCGEKRMRMGIGMRMESGG